MTPEPSPSKPRKKLFPAWIIIPIAGVVGVAAIVLAVSNGQTGDGTITTLGNANAPADTNRPTTTNTSNANATLNSNSATNNSVHPDWASFDNGEFGYIIRYPADWKRSDTTRIAALGGRAHFGIYPPSIHPADPSYASLYLEGDKNPSRLSLQDWYAARTTGPNYYTSGATVTDMTVPTTTQAVRFTAVPGAVVNDVVALRYGTVIVEIIWHQDASLLPTFNDIVSTFRATP